MAQSQKLTKFLHDRIYEYSNIRIYECKTASHEDKQKDIANMALLGLMSR